MSVLQLATVASLVVAVAGFVDRRRRERKQVADPLAEEMRAITDYCREIHNDATDKESTEKKMWISIDSLSYDMYEENKSELGVLTSYEREHIHKYYESVKGLYQRANPETHGTLIQDHAKTLTEQIIREHEEVHDYLEGGRYHRWKAQITEGPWGKHRL